MPAPPSITKRFIYCLLSVGGGSEQLSREHVEFQALVCICALSSVFSPLAPLGKKKINPVLLTRLVMEPSPKYSFWHL